jgi:16S rRNA (guanine527-N7)-methyltransferase
MNYGTSDQVHVTVEISPLDERVEAKLKAYSEILARWSSDKVRLTGPKDEDTIWKDHVRDSLFALELLPKTGRLVDVGTGGGLPGLAWAICRPDLEITLLDSQSKKTGALESIVSELEVENVSVIWGRSEQLALEEREVYDLAAARGVSEVGIVAEYLSPLVKVGGTALSIKGPGYREELAKIKGQWDLLGLDYPKIFDYSNGERQGFLLTFRKKSHCPEVYPRRPGKAEKKPWWEAKR